MSMYHLVDHIENLVQEIADDSAVARDVNVIEVGGVTVGSNIGNATDGTLRVAVASDDVNLSAINTSTGDCKVDLDELYDCIDHTNKNLAVDNKRVNGNSITVNSGAISNGTQRICIADNDTNLLAINTNINSINTHLNDSNQPLYSNVTQFNGFTVRTGNGNYDLGCLRIVLANDDPNVSIIQQTIQNMYTAMQTPGGQVVGIYLDGNAPNVNKGNANAGTQRVCIADDDTNLSQLLAILSDVYDPVAHTLKVSVIP